ncbi:MAG: hypothetical protein GX333_07045 [Syntrophomonadaceae bacterium]|nr:hypothetical protein [Syntrophomonadaceae bacterium]
MTVLVLVLVFSVVIPYVAGTFSNIVPVLNTWFDDEHPSGNPMRVETKENTKFDEMVDYVVFQLQEFYQD